jgi:LmbE family N-acetylglucosaminyl deacetylase
MAKFIRYGTLFRLYEKIQPFLKYSLPVEERLPGEKILVVAPHPDDEVIGCGGTILRHRELGGSAKVLYCTSDGHIRDAELCKSAAVLNVEYTELGYGVRTLSGNNDFMQKLAAEISAYVPDILFVPFIIDNHPDHRAVNEALVKAAKTNCFNCMIYAYPVWFPLYPNVLVDVSAVREKKNAAIYCYQSQLATRDYIKMSDALTSYWGCVKGRGIAHAESFFKASFSKYMAMAGDLLS